MNVPFLDLPAQFREIQSEALDAVARVLAGGRYVLGPEVEAFESEFAAYVGTKHVVACNSGSSALQLALLACGVGREDEVITVPHTFVATVAAVLYIGARPVFVDVDPRTYVIDHERIEAAIGPKTRAILPVHLYGQSAAMDAILELAGRRGLDVIEDCAQAHGAEHRGRRCGTMGRASCFSFYPGKNLGACGEGGAVATNDDEVARKLRMLRDWGCRRKYHHETLGYNFRMDAIQGALLRIKLRRLESWTEARRRHAATYDRILSEAGLPIPYVSPLNRHVYHIYPFRSRDRDRLIAELRARGVEAGIHYPIPVHLQPGYKTLGGSIGAFPASEAIAADEASLPIYPEMTPEQAEFVARTVAEIENSLLAPARQ